MYDDEVALLLVIVPLADVHRVGFEGAHQRQVSLNAATERFDREVHCFFQEVDCIAI
jgi:hypothetical protein